MKFLAASTFSLVALEITSYFPFSIIQIDYKPLQSPKTIHIIFYDPPSQIATVRWPSFSHNNMTQIIIPANTNNSISKVADFEYGPSSFALYIGTLEAASDPFTLKQYKVASVLTVASEFVVKPGAGITHKVIAVEDSPFENIYEHISEANDFVKQQLGKGNVLVHCRAGISRSATIITAFLMKSKRWKLKHALEYLRGCRSIVKPNEGFMEQLKNYQRKLAKALQQKQLRLK